MQLRVFVSCSVREMRLDNGKRSGKTTLTGEESTGSCWGECGDVISNAHVGRGGEKEGGGDSQGGGGCILYSTIQSITVL